MVLEGIIEEIIFRNDSNGYTVAMLSHGDEYTTVVGKFLTINEGENVRLSGKFVTNAKYGEQFSFDSSETIFPSTVEGIKRYLSSGLIRGVGPVTASAIVDKFKEDTFDIIENDFEKLASVKGITYEKAEIIHNEFVLRNSMRNFIIEAQRYEISINMATKIYEKYKIYHDSGNIFYYCYNPDKIP